MGSCLLYTSRWNQDTLFGIIRSFTTTIEEESYVSILFCFCDVQLSLTVSSQVFTLSLIHICINQEHPDLLDNLWTNPGEIPENGIDAVSYTHLVHILFDKENVQNTLGEYLAANGKTQLHIAETEK